MLEAPPHSLLPAVGAAALFMFFFFSSRRRHTRFDCDWSSDVCSSDLCTFIKFVGDGFLAVFANAADGLPFARSIQSLLRILPSLSGRGLGFRFSLHFGDCLCIETSYGKDVFGNNINLVAYLNDLAQPGQIVISQAALDRMPAEQQALAGPGEAVPKIGRAHV